MKKIAVLLLTLIKLASDVQSQSILQTVKQWKLFNFNFPSNAPVDDLNFYNPRNVVATCITVGYDRIFIATPKLFSGVPSTVSYVEKSDLHDSPVLQAYPNWSFSTTGRTNFKCSDLVLISVYRLRIDSCNRLWILDSGISRSFEDAEFTCPPKILVIDLNSNEVIRRVDFPAEVVRNQSLFTNLVIDESTSTSGTCNDVFIYISDTVAPALVVYDSNRNLIWRVTHPAMYPDPDFSELRIINDSFTVMDGVIGLAFSEMSGTLYFQPLATDRVYSVSKEVLRAGPLTQNQVLNVKLVGRKSSQGLGLTISPLDGSLIFSPLTETVISSWNPITNKQAVLGYDMERLQFVADISTSQFEPGVIYATSSKFQRFFLKNLNPNEINMRLLRIELPDVTSSYGVISYYTNVPVYFLSLLGTGAQQFGSFHSNFLKRTNNTAPALNSIGGIPKYNKPHLGVHKYSTEIAFSDPDRQLLATALTTVPREYLSTSSATYGHHRRPSVELHQGYIYGRATRSLKSTNEERMRREVVGF